MPVSLIPSFLVYCFVGGITLGPANLCSLSAALRYGRGPALRQWRGLFTGFFLDAMGAVALTWLLGAALNEYVGMLAWVGAACRLVLPVARHHGMTHLYLTCAESNSPSYRTIEGLGAELVEIRQVPREYFAWREGMERQRIYRLAL